MSGVIPCVAICAHSGDGSIETADTDGWSLPHSTESITPFILNHYVCSLEKHDNMVMCIYCFHVNGDE